MDSELEEYLSNIGLSSNMLKTTPSQPTAATVACRNDEDVDDDVTSNCRCDDNDNVDVCRASERPNEETVASTSTTLDRNSQQQLHNTNERDVVAERLARAQTDGDWWRTTDRCALMDECDGSTIEDLVHYVAPVSSSQDNTHDVKQTSYSSDATSADCGCSQQPTGAVNGDVPTWNCSGAGDESGSSKSAAVYSTVPHHSPDRLTSHPAAVSSTSLSTCTVTLNAPAVDLQTSSPKLSRVEETWPAEQSPRHGGIRPSQDNMSSLSYTSTIIRCSASSSQVIASNKPTQFRSSHRDSETSCSAVDDVDNTQALSKPQIKTTPNYVSVIQVGPATLGATDTRGFTVSSTPGDPVDSISSVVHQNPSQFSPQQSSSGDPASTTPMKSSLKKMSPKHIKNKSVSFSTGSGDDNEDDAVSVTMSTETSRPVTHPPSLADAVVRLDRNGVDGGISPRRAADSGIFCELDDDVTTVTAPTPPSRRTTVIVSGGTASIKNSPEHHPNVPSVTQPDIKNDKSGKRSLNSSTVTTGSRHEQVSTPHQNANNTDNGHKLIKATPEDTECHEQGKTTGTNKKCATTMSNRNETTSTKQRKRSQRSSTNKQQCRTQ